MSREVSSAAGAVGVGLRRSSPRHPRPSLLREVRLSDGRLAWPLARERGVSEQVFRARLKRGLAPDEAVFRPVERRARGYKQTPGLCRPCRRHRSAAARGGPAGRSPAR